MEIYVLRHGIAEEGSPGGSDAERSLNDEGRRKLRDVMRLAAKAGVSPSVMISSPYVRAVQTAAIAAEVLGYRSELLQTPALKPCSDPESVWEEVRLHRGAASVMLVGHEPLLSRVVGFLLAAPALFVDMKKSALVRVDIEEFRSQPRGELKWMIVPKLA